nr:MULTISPECIES: hypothetical protein [unclassified Cryobacterium]
MLFYKKLLGFDVTVRNNSAALLVGADDGELNLREIGARAEHPLGPVGIQYLIWTAEDEEELRRCERVLRAQSPHVTSQTIDGFRMVEGRGPDDVPIVVTYPGPEQAPRHEIVQRIYEW